MRRIATSLVAVAGGFMLFVQNAAAMHRTGNPDVSSGGFAWHTVALWSGIGIAIVLLGTWLMVEGRRHHWRPPHRPVTHT